MSNLDYAHRLKVTSSVSHRLGSSLALSARNDPSPNTAHTCMQRMKL